MSKNPQGVEEIFDYNMTVLKDKLQTFDKEYSAAYILVMLTLCQTQSNQRTLMNSCVEIDEIANKLFGE
jgi:hypothetical protein